MSDENVISKEMPPPPRKKCSQRPNGEHDKHLGQTFWDDFSSSKTICNTSASKKLPPGGQKQATNSTSHHTRHLSTVNPLPQPVAALLRSPARTLEGSDLIGSQMWSRNRVGSLRVFYNENDVIILKLYCVSIIRYRISNQIAVLQIYNQQYSGKFVVWIGGLGF